MPGPNIACAAMLCCLVCPAPLSTMSGGDPKYPVLPLQKISRVAEGGQSGVVLQSMSI